MLKLHSPLEKDLIWILNEQSNEKSWQLTIRVSEILYLEALA